MSILKLQNRVKLLESQSNEDFDEILGVMDRRLNTQKELIARNKSEIDLFKMSLQDQIKKLEDQLIKEMDNRQADFNLIEKLDKRIRELELRTPKKRGRKPKNTKLSSEDFD